MGTICLIITLTVIIINTSKKAGLTFGKIIRWFPYFIPYLVSGLIYVIAEDNHSVAGQIIGIILSLGSLFFIFLGAAKIL